ncbi:MAG: hypothetical protein HGB11_06770 [Chlorobiales bacterium]|nr:hypothetical protein [Chlorobiales bacterium]
MWHNAFVSLLKNRLVFGGLFLAIILFCLLLVPRAGFAQSSIHPQFYGLDLAFSVSSEIRQLKPAELLKSSRPEAAIDKATTVFHPLAEQLLYVSNQLAFSDWMRVQLAMKTVKALYSSQPEQHMATAGLVRAMGFYATLLEFRDAKGKKRYGYGLAVASRQKIFGGAMFDHENATFIVLDIKSEAPERGMNSEAATIIYDPGALKPIDLAFSAVPKLPVQLKKTARRWSDDQGSYSLPVMVNMNLIRYYESCPQLDIRLHFSQPVNADLVPLLIEPFKKLLAQKNLSGAEAVQFLLTFCHQAFTHQDDKKNTGIEHHNFVEETLVANASDCEDFVLLFSVLLRGVLGYSVVGLEYPNHVSLAVALPEGYGKGERYRYKEKTYVHCDPSFIGCSIGEVQPEFKNMNPKVVPIDDLVISGK